MADPGKSCRGMVSIGEEAIRDSYTQLFAEQIPEILFYQRDRPHYFNLFLKGIALVVVLSVAPVLTLLPIYPFLYVLLLHKFNPSSAFGGGTGRLNLYWIAILYVFYIFSAGKFVGGVSSGTSNATNTVGSSGFVGIMMGLTPVMLLLTWYYAMPVSVHDAIASMYNSMMGKGMFETGWIPYSYVRCPTDVISRLEKLGAGSGGGGSGGGGQVGGGLSSMTFFGMGLSGTAIFILAMLLITMIFAYMWILWKSREIERQGSASETN
jgi:hypothetical protein